MIRIACLVLTVAAFALADLSETALVRARGLFLWDRSDAKAKASEFLISDSVQTKILDVNAFIRKRNVEFFWENGWGLNAKLRMIEGGAGIRGNFRNLAVESGVCGNDDWGFGKILTAVSFSDSLIFAGVRLNGGSVGGLRAKWTSESVNGILDTMKLEYRGEFLSKGIFAGSRFQKHSVEISGDYLQTFRAPLESDGYALRDSSKAFWFAGEYGYRFDAGRLSFDFLWLDVDAKLFALRTEDGSVKRFGYLPFRADVVHGGGSLELERSRFRLGGTWAHGRLSRDGNRFFESLAPNRALKSSLLQTLSFAYFKRDYLLYGTADGFLLNVGAARNFPMAFGNFRLIPEIAADVFYAQGNLDATIENVSTTLFVRKRSRTFYEGSLYAAGALADVSVELSMEHFFAKIECAQIVPFAVSRRLELRGKSSSAAEKDDSPDEKSSGSRWGSSPVFRTGFAVEASAGIRF